MIDGLTDAVYRGLPDDAIWACIRERRDEVALRAFLYRHGGRLLACARAVTGDEHTAQDAVQEAMIRLIRDRARLPNHRAAMAWLYVALDRAARVVRRAERRRKAREEQVSFARPEGVSSSDPDMGEIRGVVNRAVADLPARERRAVELVYFEGLTHADAADALGWSRGAVGSYLTRALRRLEGLLAKRGVTAAGGVIAIEAALRAAPPGGLMDTVWLLDAVSRATEESVMHGWGMAFVARHWGLVALSGLGLITAGLVWQSMVRPAPVPMTPVEVESLQAKNLRLFHADVLPSLLVEFRQMVPADNSVRLMAARAYGSVVEGVFETERPLLPGLRPTGLRMRYCMFRRRMETDADLSGTGTWKAINLERPIILDLAIPDLRLPAADLGKAWVAACRTAFAHLPADDRAEADLVRHVFGERGHDLIVPPEVRSATGDGGRVFVTTGDDALFLRTTDGWRYLGECRGWFLATTGDKLYADGHAGGAGVWQRPVTGVEAEWVRVCDRPPEDWGRFRVCGMAVAGGRVHYAVVRHPDGATALWSRSLDDAKAEWTRGELPVHPNSLTGSGTWLYSVASENALVRRVVADPTAAWERVGPMPASCDMLQAVGSQLWAFDRRQGPIHTRPISGDAATKWTVVGRIREPDPQ